MNRSIRRRRLEAKTDYGARLALLKSPLPRLVVRKTNRYVIAQIVGSNLAQDKVLLGIDSRSLLSKGWPKEKSYSIKNFAAYYLTGYMLGKAAKSKVKEAIFDIGMNRNVKKSKIYALLKGVNDAGLKVPHNVDILPSDETIKQNKNISQIFDKIKSNI